ncbi:U-box domain-containing protein [Musa troglodytarum]|uniref:RING-type E3 ubiquitin transferase n=2 Tax=Musa troglodytarum TaxID=320322 RepID=A0A9E7ER49_9LILI|nr:U-box domain-containing protein [Musa troglodytarum]
MIEFRERKMCNNQIVEKEEGKDFGIEEMEEGDRLVHDSLCTVALAIDGTKKSKYVVQWALNKFGGEGRVMFKLLHVQPRIKMIPTLMGNLAVNQVREDVASAYKKEQGWRTQTMLRPYKDMCSQKQIETKVVVLEADDVAEAIAKEVTENTIRNLVIGTSSRNALMRKFKRSKLPARIAECKPSFCTVYVVSKGKLSSVCASVSEMDETASTSITDDGAKEENDSSALSSSFSSNSRNPISELIDSGAEVKSSFQLTCLPQLQQKAFISKDHGRFNLVDTLLTRNISLLEDSRISSSYVSESQYSNSIASLRSCQTVKSWNFTTSSTSYSSKEYSPSGNEEDIDLELEKLRTELRHPMGMFKFVPNELHSASQQLHDIHEHDSEEIFKPQETRSRLEKTGKMAQQENERHKAAEKEAIYVNECTTNQRKDVDNSTADEDSEKQTPERELACSSEPYMKYNWEEIVDATLSFSDALKIGVGANGTVYKGIFHHTVAAVKVLHSSEGSRTRQFNQELEVLGRVCHPHVLVLLGACPDKGCLVYEYMENGSLEDRLQCKNDTLPLPWFHRFRIAWEVASALMFLHNSRPEPIIHRDLKPANILLDNNFVSKIGDAGLSTLIPTSNMPLSTMYKDTVPAGTFFYMDPEYQRTGLVSTKSDTYALGMVILELLTAKSPMGLAFAIETALETDCLMDILDSKAGQWPEAEAKELANLGLRCLEMRRKDRPELKDQVLPVLERLKDTVAQAHVSARDPSVPPNHFICPILKTVMDDPCIAADGYTYNRLAIGAWLSWNENSPMTNLPLPNKELIPDNSLLSAIIDWKARTR